MQSHKYSSEQGGLCRLGQTVTNTWPRGAWHVPGSHIPRATWLCPHIQGRAWALASKLRAYLDTGPWFTPVTTHWQRV